MYALSFHSDCYSHKMRLTNVVFQANLNVKFNLDVLVHQLNNVRYDPRTFPGIIYQNRKIGGNCLIFSNGKINCNGRCSHFKAGLKRLRQYARILQRLEYPVRLSNVRLVTSSAVHKLSAVIISYVKLYLRPGVVSCCHVTSTRDSFYMSLKRHCTHHRYQKI